jgi:dienelactone hydrolase
MFSIFRRVAQLCISVSLCCSAWAQPQTIEFKSLERKQGFPALMSGRAKYDDMANGVFTRPGNAVGNVPVMVIMHGSGGKSDIGTGEWSRFFLSMGIATLEVDSFGPRGISATAADQSQLSYAASTVDALMALQAVAKLPGIDVSKIGVIGFSRGGQASTNSGYVKVRSAVLKESKLAFALHIALYGGCSMFGTPDKTPILFLMGDDDDYAAPATCSHFVDVMRSRGANIAFEVYPNTKHGFDQDRKDLRAPRAQTWKTCAPRSQDIDSLTYSVGGKDVSGKEYGEAMGKCMTTGVTVGPNYPAITASRTAVKSFVSKNFAM